MSAPKTPAIEELLNSIDWSVNPKVSLREVLRLCNQQLEEAHQRRQRLQVESEQLAAETNQLLAKLKAA